MHPAECIWLFHMHAVHIQMLMDNCHTITVCCYHCSCSYLKLLNLTTCDLINLCCRLGGSPRQRHVQQNEGCLGNMANGRLSCCNMFAPLMLEAGACSMCWCLIASLWLLRGCLGWCACFSCDVCFWEQLLHTPMSSTAAAGALSDCELHSGLAGCSLLYWYTFYWCKSK
jgi:hypothetical protein